MKLLDDFARDSITAKAKAAGRRLATDTFSSGGDLAVLIEELSIRAAISAATLDLYVAAEQRRRASTITIKNPTKPGPVSAPCLEVDS